MQALRINGERDLELCDIAPPGEPAEGEVQVRIRAVALNHIDVWGWRGMAFAKRELPVIAGAEAVSRDSPLAIPSRSTVR